MSDGVSGSCENGPVTVFAAFISTWSSARQTFGEGDPQSGAPFDQSATLRQLATDVESAAPGSRWTGAGANAYAAANTEHGRVISELAGLDQLLGAQVDDSARIVSAGRQELEDVRQWVADAVASVPQNAAGERIRLQIVNEGIGKVIDIIHRHNGALAEVAEKIRILEEKYQILGKQKFGPRDLPLDPKHDEDPEKSKLDEILEKYQVSEDPNGEITIDLPFMDPITVTDSEARLLARIGPYDAYQVYQIGEQARAEANKRFPGGDQHDNQNDAFRHAYANALLTEKFGQDWTNAYGKAHERTFDNPSAVEAMDLYNNEVGQQIAAANPDASPEELANKVQDAVQNGDTVVVRTDGNGLEWSNRIESSQTGDGGSSPPLPGSDPKPLPYP